MSYGLSIPDKGKKIFLLFPGSSARGPPNLLYNGYKGLFPLRINLQEREADHSLLFGAEVKNDEAIPHSPIRLHGIVLN
jgi:hypothetical protein